MPAASDYELLETIGQGSFGKVCKIRRKVDGKVRRPSASLNLPTHRQWPCLQLLVSHAPPLCPLSCQMLVWKVINYSHMTAVEKQRLSDEVRLCPPHIHSSRPPILTPFRCYIYR